VRHLVVPTACRYICLISRLFFRTGHYAVNQFVEFFFVLYKKLCIGNWPTVFMSFLIVPRSVVFWTPTSFFTCLRASVSASLDGAPKGRRHVWPNRESLQCLHASYHDCCLVILYSSMFVIFFGYLITTILFGNTH